MTVSWIAPIAVATAKGMHVNVSIKARLVFSYNPLIEWQSLDITPTSLLHQYWCICRLGDRKPTDGNQGSTMANH